MDEDAWLACRTPKQLLAFRRGPVHVRKRRLFACACFRLIWSRLPDARSRQAVDVFERHVDGLVGQDELEAARKAAKEASDEADRRLTEAAHRNIGPQHPSAAAKAEAVAAHVEALAASVAASAPERLIRDRLESAIAEATHCVFLTRMGDGGTWLELRKIQLELLRDIFGNPFRPASVDPSWLATDGRSAASLARELYEHNRLDEVIRLPDLLETSGCRAKDLIDHCRNGGLHARGCWAIDLLRDGG